MPVSDNKADEVDAVGVDDDAVESQPGNHSAQQPAVTPPRKASDSPVADKSPLQPAAPKILTPAEKIPAAADPPSDPTPIALGAFLTGIREKRGVTHDQLAKESRIPEHYVRMIEGNDYAKIADQLYMLPFIRRYAEYFALDVEEIAMRFVREVQRADNQPPSNRLDQPLDVVESKRGGLRGGLLVVAVLAIAIGFYFYQSARHRMATEAPAPSQSQSLTPSTTH